MVLIGNPPHVDCLQVPCVADLVRMLSQAMGHGVLKHDGQTGLEMSSDNTVLPFINQ